MGGTVDGVSGDHVLLAPPFICTADDIDRIVSRLTDAIEGALRVAGVR
jgi:adenosylmethionine-8-amino-7-oxononanoate aminotransferase